MEAFLEVARRKAAGEISPDEAVAAVELLATDNGGDDDG